MRAVISVLMLFLMACDSSEEVAKERVSKDSSTPEHIRRIEADDPNDIAVLLYRRCNFDGTKYVEYFTSRSRDSVNPSSVWDGSLAGVVWLTLIDLRLSEEEESQFSILVSMWKEDGLVESGFAKVVSAMEQAGLVSKEGAVLKRTSAGEECFNSLRSTFGKMYQVRPFFRLEKKRAAEQRQKVAKERQLKDSSTPEHIRLIEADDPNDIAVLLYRGCSFDGSKYGEHFEKRPQKFSCVIVSHWGEEMVWLTLVDLQNWSKLASLEELWEGIAPGGKLQFAAVVSAMEQAGLVSREGSVLKRTSAGEECFNSLRSTFWKETRSLGHVRDIQALQLKLRLAQMEAVGVTYEDGKFHYEGKAYDSFSHIPRK